MANNFSNDGRERALVGERHKFKSPNLSPKNDGEASGENNPGSGVTADDKDDTSPPPALASSTEKALNDIIEGTTAYREYIRLGGMPESNAQWTSQLATNHAEETRRAKSPPGTPPRSHELEEEGALLRATQAMAPPLRIPLDLRLTEEELRLRETRTVLERLSNVVADIVEDENLNAAVDLIKDKLDEDEASEQKDSENQSSSSEKDEASEDTLIDMTENVNEEGLFRPNFNAEHSFLKELEERSKFGLLDTLEDTHVAFRTILE
jgi:hypothetical protein